jgi:hypothetical protein
VEFALVNTRAPRYLKPIRLPMCFGPAPQPKLNAICLSAMKTSEPAGHGSVMRLLKKLLDSGLAPCKTRRL